MKIPRDVLLTALVVTGTCCSAAATAPDRSTGRTLEGVGVLPDTGSSIVEPVTAPDLAGTVDVIGQAAGNRVLVIGDSILASTSARYSNDMCKALVPLGWRVEVDAETSRFVDFADEVLDQRLPAGFDAVVIGLGSNYGKKEDVYRRYLEEAVERVAPRPVVLVTVTEFEASRKEVNHAIAEIAATHDHVTIADWATASTDRSLLGNDRLHLTPKGRAALAALVAATLGTAPTQPGECLDSRFVDDSRGSVEGGPATTAKRSGATTTEQAATTTKPTTKPTVKPSGTTTTRPPASTVVGPSTTPPAPTTSSAVTTPSTTAPTQPTTTPVATTQPPVPTPTA